MKGTSAIASRFREVILNGTWVANTNYKQQLSGLGWELALAQHIHYYIEGINNVFKGGGLDIRDKFSFDFPSITSQEEWDNFLNKFWCDAEEFALLIEQMPGKKLNQTFVEKKYGTYRRNIDGMIEHCYYHLGQIVLIKNTIIREVNIAVK